MCLICQGTITQPFRCGFQQARGCVALIEWCYSTDCRHIFCGPCLFTWWQNSWETSCPACWTICEKAPVGDNVSNGLVSLISTDPVGTVEPFYSDGFVALMMQIKGEATMVQAEETTAADPQFFEGIGTFIDPLDLTGE